VGPPSRRPSRASVGAAFLTPSKWGNPGVSKHS